MPMDQTQTLSRALAILDCFDVDQRRLGVREIARRTRISRSTVGRLLGTMHSAGVLSRDPVTRCYMMGSKVLAWSAVYTSGLDIRSKARVAMEELHRDTRETVSLYILDGDERMCIERIESPESLRIVARIGERMPIHIEASGKVFLAFVSPELRKRIISQVYRKRPPPERQQSRNALLEDLKRIQTQGYALSRGERVAGASCVSAPIFDATGQVIAAITISGPTIRLTERKISEYASRVMSVTAQVSRAMGLNGSAKLPNRGVEW